MTWPREAYEKSQGGVSNVYRQAPSQSIKAITITLRNALDNIAQGRPRANPDTTCRPKARHRFGEGEKVLSFLKGWKHKYTCDKTDRGQANSECS